MRVYIKKLSFFMKEYILRFYCYEDDKDKLLSEFFTKQIKVLPFASVIKRQITYKSVQHIGECFYRFTVYLSSIHNIKNALGLTKAPYKGFTFYENILEMAFKNNVYIKSILPEGISDIRFGKQVKPLSENEIISFLLKIHRLNEYRVYRNGLCVYKNILMPTQTIATVYSKLLLCPPSKMNRLKLNDKILIKCMGIEIPYLITVSGCKQITNKG